MCFSFSVGLYISLYRKTSERTWFFNPLVLKHGVLIKQHQTARHFQKTSIYFSWINSSHPLKKTDKNRGYKASQPTSTQAMTSRKKLTPSHGVTRMVRSTAVSTPTKKSRPSAVLTEARKTRTTKRDWRKYKTWEKPWESHGKL